MRGPISLLLIAVTAIAGWFFFSDYPFTQTLPNVVRGPVGHQSQPFGSQHSTNGPYGQPPMPSASPNIPGVSQRPSGGVANSPLNPVAGNRRVPIANFFPRDPRFVRVASFNIEMLERDKAANLQSMHMLASIMAQFDIVAVQGVAVSESYAVGQLVDVINSSGRQYDYVLGPRVGRDEASMRQFAFVYDVKRVEVDSKEVYTVEDPDDLLRWEPLVAWFRTRSVNPNDAFTFTLVNMEADPDEKERESAILGGVFREVRNDLRREDDVILAGCFRMPCKQIDSQANAVPNSDWALTGTTPSNTQGTAQDDNIMSCHNFTDEATGRVGVFDFLRQLNLSLDQAENISTHLPVWAEFTMNEGGM